MSDATGPGGERATAKATDTQEDKRDTESDGSGERASGDEWTLTEDQRAACKTMFEKLSVYLNGELTG